MKTFDKAVEQHLDKLELFVPVVARVHGEHHPEFHDFKKVYDCFKLGKTFSVKVE